MDARSAPRRGERPAGRESFPSAPPVIKKGPIRKGGAFSYRQFEPGLEPSLIVAGVPKVHWDWFLRTKRVDKSAR